MADLRGTATSSETVTAPETAERPEKLVRPSRSSTMRTFYMGIGSVFVGAGVIGIFVPLWPTTIFLILAAACYGRSSPRAYRWLTTNRLFGSYLRNYQEHKGATLRAKIISITSLWLGIGSTIVFVPTPVWVNLILLGIAIGVAWHLLRLNTIRKDTLPQG